jgi:hypothetical protein
MSESYLRLSKKERNEILTSLSPVIGLTSELIEKDIWICWSLEKLFSMPNQIPMAFKGGTTLSKIYNVIQRFSEDIDITIDYKGLKPEIDPFDRQLSKTAQKKLGAALKASVKKYVKEIVYPHYEDIFTKEIENEQGKIILEDQEDNVVNIKIQYPSALEENNDTYIQNIVLLEFGGRNTTEPSENHSVEPIISKNIPNLLFPSAVAKVLSPIRTFWEKVTLIHVECNKNNMKANVDRLSRHWYDLSRLSQHAIGKKAIKDTTMLENVVNHKKIFFNSSHANYDACLNKKIKLIPENYLLNQLELDFNEMKKAKMFYGEQPSFQEILNKLHILEDELNSTTL